MDEKIVLLVEDNEDDIELTLRSFKKQNISNRVVVARNGQEALDYLFGQGSYAGQAITLPVVILLDLKLPMVSGIDVLRQVRSNSKTCLIPVVVLTTSSEDKDKLESYGLGANSYIRKPIDFDRFLEATRELGMYWLLLNEPPL